MTEGEKRILVRQRITKAKATIRQVNNLLEFGYEDTAIDRIYYACFYAVQALLAHMDNNPNSHKGALNMFSLHYIKTGIIDEKFGKYYYRVFDHRMTADYDESGLPDKEVLQAL